MWMDRLPEVLAIALPPEDEAEKDEAEDVPMFKREDAAVDAAAADPPGRPATCAASDRRVTAAAAEVMAEQGKVAIFVMQSRDHDAIMELVCTCT
jgi:hypothetical protein